MIFSEKANKAMISAESLAAQLGDKQTNPLHILYVLLQQEDSGATILMKEAGLDLDSIRNRLKRLLTENKQPPIVSRSERSNDWSEALPLVLRHSIATARSAGKQVVDSRSLLRGVIEVLGSSSDNVLGQGGVDVLMGAWRIDSKREPPTTIERNAIVLREASLVSDWQLFRYVLDKLAGELQSLETECGLRGTASVLDRIREMQWACDRLQSMPVDLQESGRRESIALTLYILHTIEQWRRQE